MALYRVILPHCDEAGSQVRYTTVEVEAESEPEAKRLALVEFEDMTDLASTGAGQVVVEQDIRIERAPVSRRAALEVSVANLSPDVASARLVGSLTSGNFTQFQEALDSLQDQDVERLVLDLSGLTYVNSTGLSLFVAAADMFDLRLAAVPARIMRLLKLIGLAEILPSYGSVSDAAR